MRPEDLRAFAKRRWDLVEDEKVKFRAERFRAGGPAASFAAAQRLRERFRRLHPEGSHPDARRADLEAHVALTRVFARAAHAFERR